MRNESWPRWASCGQHRARGEQPDRRHPGQPGPGARTAGPRRGGARGARAEARGRADRPHAAHRHAAAAVRRNLRFAGYVEAVDPARAGGLPGAGGAPAGAHLIAVRARSRPRAVSVNRQELQQVLVNLLVNAIHAMEGGIAAPVTREAEGGWVEITGRRHRPQPRARGAGEPVPALRHAQEGRHRARADQPRHRRTLRRRHRGRRARRRRRGLTVRP